MKIYVVLKTYVQTYFYHEDDTTTEPIYVGTVEEEARKSVLPWNNDSQASFVMESWLNGKKIDEEEL